MAGADYDRVKEVKEFDESKMGVKGLSDSTITSIPRFFIHPSGTLSQLKSSSSSALEIPVIDLSNSDSPHLRPKIVDQIRDASKTWGFFQVVNHGIPLSALEETINAIKSFHDQPQEVKAKHYMRDERRGVTFFTNNDLYRAEAATWFDSLQAWMAPEPLEVEKIPEICRKEMVAWDMQATKLAESLMVLLGEGLGLGPSKFKEMKFTESRLFLGHCYPYCPQADLTLGIRSHTDTASLTVLLPNHVPGLQVKHGDDWVDAKPLPGALMINIGDFLQILSNGEYKSIEHQVLANPFKDARISIVMFFNLEMKESEFYGPLLELLSPKKPPIYRKFQKKEYFDNFISKGLDSKSIIDKLTI